LHQAVRLADFHFHRTGTCPAAESCEWSGTTRGGTKAKGGGVADILK
jgi:hypothetical protein